MNNSIQENEMYLASQFCKKTSEEFTSVLLLQTKIYETEVLDCNNKIQYEKREISFLREQINLCNQLLIENRERIRQIPLEINNLEEDNKRCIENIRRTEIPVYTTYYSRFLERWCTEIDEPATYENKMHVSRMEDRIEDNKRTMGFLFSQKTRCENNVLKLLAMIRSINDCIAKKEKLISKIKNNIIKLQTGFANFKKDNSICQLETQRLNDKIVKGAELIHGFGSELAKINYKNGSVSYSQNNIFTATSETLNEEIRALSTFVSSNNALLGDLYKGTSAFDSQLEDEITRQAKEISTIEAKKIEQINDVYQNNINTLKKASAFLAEYEKIRI